MRDTAIESEALDIGLNRREGAMGRPAHEEVALRILVAGDWDR